MDPRLDIIGERLTNIKKLMPVASGKGGVGKSLVSSIFALFLSRMNYEVGLLDLDLHGPSVHTILGTKPRRPEERKGIIPPEDHGIKILSIVSFTGDYPTMLRGSDISNAIVELLAITRWQSLDFLIVDMPPGIGDETLDIVRLMRKAEFVVLTTPSKVALATVKKLIRTLKELEVPIRGVIENMKTNESQLVREELYNLQIPFLGEIRFDEHLEGSIGNVDKLLRTNFARDFKGILGKLIESF